MLLRLRVRNFAIIDELEVAFEPGLNAVTGETGAGKSILVSALGLVLGARGRSEVVRTGARSAEVEALFDISDDPEVQRRVREAGLAAETEDEAGGEAAGEADEVADETELVLRRVVSANGRTHAYANGRLATGAQLVALAQGLVSISSQHEHHALVDPTTHLYFLDAFAGLLDLREQVGRAHETLLRVTAEHERARQQSAGRSEREDLLRFQLSEIDACDPRPAELEELLVERDRQRHAERLSSLGARAEHELYAGDEALCTQLARIADELRDASALDPALVPMAELIEAAQASLEDASRDLGSWGRNITGDPERLAELEERATALQRLQRKYGGTLEAVIEHRDSARQELEQLSGGDRRIAELQTELDAALAAARKLAGKLSSARKRSAEKLAAAISEELGTLGMGDARIVVEVVPAPARGSEPTLDGARLTPSGIDRVEFLIATNRGEQPRSLHKIASGGELSRAMLAIKRVLAGLGPAGLYVFDEVDAGVGGAMAEVIGRKLGEVARHHQVICITHLPQIAAFADAHFRVRKQVRKGRTLSLIEPLDRAERQDEIARMLGGVEITPKTRAAAVEMLKKSRARKK